MILTYSGIDNSIGGTKSEEIWTREGVQRYQCKTCGRTFTETFGRLRELDEVDHPKRTTKRNL